MRVKILNLLLPIFMFSWNVIGIHWARLSRAPSVQMLVCQEEGQAVIDAIMAFAIVNIALTVPGRRIHQRIVGEFCVFFDSCIVSILHVMT